MGIIYPHVNTFSVVENVVKTRPISFKCGKENLPGVLPGFTGFSGAHLYCSCLKQSFRMVEVQKPFKMAGGLCQETKYWGLTEDLW